MITYTNMTNAIPMEISELEMKVPNYFKNYGINSNKFLSMYDALRKKGINHYPSFVLSWQAIKELPKSYYAFGKSHKDVESWADHMYKTATTSDLYKNVINALNYDDYYKAMKKFNPNPTYWNEWLIKGMDDAEKFILQNRLLNTFRFGGKIHLINKKYLT